MSSRSKSPAPMGTSGPNRYHHTVTSLQASGHHIPRSVSASYFPASPHSQMARPRSLYSLSQNNYVGSPNYSNPNRASSYMPASDYDDSIEPMVHAGHKRSASSHHLRSSSSSGALTTAVTSSASFTASAQPDRYHRRRSLANAPTTASYSNISTFQDSNSDQVMPPSPIVTPVNTSSNSLYTTNAISSSSSLSLLASSQQPQQPPQSLPSQQLQQQQHIHQETIYKNPGHSQSTSAISSASSGSKKDYSSLSSVSSYSSEGMFNFISI